MFIITVNIISSISIIGLALLLRSSRTSASPMGAWLLRSAARSTRHVSIIIIQLMMRIIMIMISMVIVMITTIRITVMIITVAVATLMVIIVMAHGSNGSNI